MSGPCDQTPALEYTNLVAALRQTHTRRLKWKSQRLGRQASRPGRRAAVAKVEGAGACSAGAASDKAHGSCKRHRVAWQAQPGMQPGRPSNASNRSAGTARDATRRKPSRAGPSVGRSPSPPAATFGSRPFPGTVLSMQLPKKRRPPHWPTSGG